MARTIKTPAASAEEYEAESPDGYEQVFAGLPFQQPAGKNWELACCHCGLVHVVKIEHDGMTRDGDELKITMRENAAATKRHRKVAGEAPALDEAYEKGYSDGMRVMRRLYAAYRMRPGPKRDAAIAKALIRPRKLDNKKAAP